MSRLEGEDHGKYVTTVRMSPNPALRHKTMAMMAHTAPSQSTSPNLREPRSSPATPNHRPRLEHSNQMSPVTSQPTRESSPRSQHSESSQTPQLGRRPARGCKFETGMAQARRRVPYSMGPEKLPAEPEEAKKSLSTEQAQRLTEEMQGLYESLLPSAESEDCRGKFVQKLDQLLRSRWPNAQITVSVFGSTGNFLGTNSSDVDICITTDSKEVENVCLIAELLAQNGMQRVVCVSSAKVPIVKAWDPELSVACDINVNNPIALENTQMIRSYIQTDDRVRPLAMIIKHWAKRRILNDAALGGTLSSYTWICMVLNFLQTRNPPILPALQQKEGLEPILVGGVNVAFDKDVDAYEHFGAHNTSSLGDLLLQFFRYFGHEFDYEGDAISVRIGKVIPKSQKAWHLLQDNRLCVEEPFNTSRNLANTADDTSMRGIHLELRRAFKLVADGELTECCQEYIHVPEEHKQTATFIHQTARPIIPQAPSQSTSSSSRGSRNNYRSSKSNNRNAASRRASNPAGRNTNYLHDLPFQMTPQELQLQAQHQQHLLHDQLFQQYQYLQLQEQELRMQLYQQSLRQRGLVSNQNYPGSAISTESPMRLPLTPTSYQNRFGNASPFLTSPSPTNGIMTNPASPLLGHVVPDNRRFTRRTSVATSAPAASLRAHSQPPRSINGSNVFSPMQPGAYELASELGDVSDRRSSLTSHASAANFAYLSHPAASPALYEAGRRPAEFMGYYVGHSPSLVAHSQSTTISPIPSHAGLAIHNGGLSPRISSHGSRIPSGTSSPSLPNASLSGVHDLSNGIRSSRYSPSPPLADGPLIIDGSLKSPKRRHYASRQPLSNSDNYTVSTTTSDDHGIDTPASSEDQYQDANDHKISFTNGSLKGSNIDGVLNQFQSLSYHPGHHISEPSGKVLAPPPGTFASNGSFTPQPNFAMASSRDTGSESHMGPISPVSARRGKTKIEKSPMADTFECTTTPPLGNRTNGVETTPKQVASPQLTDGASGWQTQKKKKKGKKAIKSESDAAALNSAGGELLPLDESLRKGG